MLISSSNVIPFPRGGGECDPQPTDRMVRDKQRSTLNGHTTDEGRNGLYKGWSPGRIVSYDEESLEEYLVKLTQSEGFGVVVYTYISCHTSVQAFCVSDDLS